LIELLTKELSLHGISFDKGQLFFRGQKSSYQDVANKLDVRIEKNTKLLRRLSTEIITELQNPTAGSADKKTRRMFAHAIKSVYEIFLECKCPLNAIKAAKNIVNADSGLFSSRFMAKVIDFNLGIQWLIHLIRRDMYTIHLLFKFSEKIRSGRQALARGFAGPWGRLDLPMEERVFQWDDIAEETAGREADKMRQRRYRMGLENTKDNWPNEGFYWREIRNEPFAWGDEDSNPYPHRNLLWRS
tara:strand:+ start:26677 stop:27408 length:732 start_codon:yes stop_codon:yes gene_type:complete